MYNLIQTEMSYKAFKKHLVLPVFWTSASLAFSLRNGDFFSFGKLLFSEDRVRGSMIIISTTSPLPHALSSEVDMFSKWAFSLGFSLGFL